VHDEFVDLADRVHEMLNERIDRITANSSNALPPSSTEFPTARAGSRLAEEFSDSLLLELELRSGDLVNKIDEAGNRLASRFSAAATRPAMRWTSP